MAEKGGSADAEEDMDRRGSASGPWNRFGGGLYEAGKREGAEKLGKKLRKTTDIAEYRAITAEIFATLPMYEELQADW